MAKIFYEVITGERWGSKTIWHGWTLKTARNIRKIQQEHGIWCYILRTDPNQISADKRWKYLL